MAYREAMAELQVVEISAPKVSHKMKVSQQHLKFVVHYT